MPPKGCWLSSKSCSVQSTASNAWRCCIGVSTQTISFVKQSMSANPEFFLIPQKLSLLTAIGILNVEWAVWPPSSRSAAMPLDATASAIFPFACMLAKKIFSRNVLPVSPRPSRKKSWDPWLMDSKTQLYASRCKWFKESTQWMDFWLFLGVISN